MHDYRVRVRMEFDVEVGTVDQVEATIAVHRIVSEVFAQSFSRARVVQKNVVRVTAIDHETPAPPSTDERRSHGR